MAFKICSNCNERVEEDWLLCKYCNVPVKNNTTDASALTAEKPANNASKIIFGIIALVIVILILFALLK
ncbi:hypothetical protein ACHHV8_10795 [Paenibacillus sp. TAB 01]|uniref:hypothetical protein n=1 Tax=Paenibacillus sp. TAB 01 TaxID=3368988 RepID=UPI003752BBBD